MDAVFLRHWDMREMRAGESGLIKALASLAGIGTLLELQQCLQASVATWGIHNTKVILELPAFFSSVERLQGQNLAIRYTQAHHGRWRQHG